MIFNRIVLFKLSKQQLLSFCLCCLISCYKLTLNITRNQLVGSKLGNKACSTASKATECCTVVSRHDGDVRGNSARAVAQGRQAFLRAQRALLLAGGAPGLRTGQLPDPRDDLHPRGAAAWTQGLRG